MNCPHGRTVVGKDNYGIFSHYHSDDDSSCDVLNVIGVRVEQIMPFYVRGFEITPEFCSAFLVSQKVRLDVYKALSTANNKKLMGFLLKLYEIVHGAAYEANIWAEMYDVFGHVFTDNMMFIVKTSLPMVGGRNKDLTSLTMVNLLQSKVQEATSEGDRVVNNWKRQAEEAAAKAAEAKRWGNRR